MNKIYRTVWNHARQCMVVASETTRSRRKSGSRKVIVEAVAAAVLSLGAGQAIAASSCTGAGGGVTYTVSGTETEQCILSGGDSLTVNSPSGKIDTGTGLDGAVYVGAGSVAGRIVNSGTLTSSANGFGAQDTIEIRGTLTSGITNSGVIKHEWYRNAINLFENANIGGITNSGLIESYATALKIDGNSGAEALVNGSIINSGTISSLSSIGIQLTYVSVSGGITNSGTLSAEETALDIARSTISGNLVNSGVIEAGLISESSALGIRIYKSVIGAGITNSGTIHVNATDYTSAGIYLDEATVTGGITNSGLIDVVGNSETIRGLWLKTSTVNGSIVNSGTINVEMSESSEAYGIKLEKSTVTGSIVNSGVINVTGATDKAYGIHLDSSTVGGGITNSGTILSTPNSGTAYGINVESTSVSGSIVNSGNIQATSPDKAYGVYISESNIGGISNSGLISGVDAGISVITSSVVTNGITNAGVVSSESANNGSSYNNAAIDVVRSSITGGIHNLAGGTITGTNTSDGFRASGIRVNKSSIEDGISNTGVISTSGKGINIESTSTISGGVLNKTGGVITSADSQAIYVGRSTLSGGVSNQSGATLSGYSGIAMSSSQVQGGVTNAGLISANGTAGLGIWNSTISGAIYNSGEISTTSTTSYSSGILLSAAQIVNGITNAANGTISGSKYGISVYTGSTISGIVNAGSISSGNTGIYVANSTLGGLTNTGLISGNLSSLNLANTGNAFTVTNTGTLSGAASIGINSLDLNGSSSRVIGNTSGTGDVNVNGTFTSEGTFDVTDFNIATGSLFNMGHGVTVSGLATNDGILNVGTSSQTITGNYDQTGIYRMGLTGTTAGTYGVLNVTGTATIAGGIDVVISGAPTIANGTTIVGVIQSTGAMTVTPADIVVTDNNLFYNFTAVAPSDSDSLDLVIAADANALTNAVLPDNTAGAGVAQALQTIYNGGVPTGFQPMFDALASMSQQELNAALIQLTPSLQGAGAQAGINALHSMNKIIQSRIESVQGLNSGDETADQYAWTRVFGNWGDQDDHRGVTGFKSKTHGLAFGIDKPINDRIRAGGLFTYANTDLQSNLGSSKVDVDTYEIGGYGSYNIDPQTDINVQLDVGFNKANSSRSISFLGTTAKADFDSFNWHLSGGIGHLFHLSDKTNLTPSVRVDYTHVKTDGYTEKGAGALNLRVEDSNYEELLLTVDSKFSHKLTDNGLKFVANGSVGYDFINERAQSTSSFTGGGSTFVTDGLDVSPWVYRGGLGLVKETGNGLEFSVRYDAEGRTSGYLNQTASVKVRWAF